MSLRFRLFIFLVLLAASASATALKSGDRFGDWSALCIAAEIDGKPTQACHIFQRVTERESQQFLVNAEIGYLPGDDKPLMSMTVPLGIAIPPGVKVEIDGKKSFTLPLGVCVAQGCRTINLQLEEQILSRLKAGSSAKVVVKNLQGRDIAIPLSLKGLTAGVQALDKLD